MPPKATGIHHFNYNTHQSDKIYALKLHVFMYGGYLLSYLDIEYVSYRLLYSSLFLFMFLPFSFKTTLLLALEFNSYWLLLKYNQKIFYTIVILLGKLHSLYTLLSSETFFSHNFQNISSPEINNKLLCSYFSWSKNKTMN